jgi:3-phosphoshikimate 1-carboxyvinyltransferase
MEDFIVLIEQRTSIKGEISVPGDRSISHRAIMFGSLAKGTTEITNFLMGEDCLSTIDCFRKMQIGIEILKSNKVRVQGKGLYGLKAPTSPLNTGKSGTTVRLLLGLMAGQPFSTILTRDESVLKKPIGKVVKPLRQMGAIIAGKEDGNICPLHISPSKLKGTLTELSILDTYIKSPILIAGLYADDETTVIEAVKSRDHSELMLNYFGAGLNIDGLKVTANRVENLYAQSIEIPGDISLASYFITAGLLVPNSDITIKNVGINPTRTGIIDVYKSMGAKIEILNERITGNEKVADIRVTSSSLNSTIIDGAIIPRLIDEIPVIAVAAATAKGTTIFRDLKSFRIKEQNRIKALVVELSKMGANIHETDDGMIIEGGRSLKGTVMESHNDHTIAMSMAIAGLIADGETMLRKAQVIDIIFPEFFEVLNSL